MSDKLTNLETMSMPVFRGSTKPAAAKSRKLASANNELYQAELLALLENAIAPAYIWLNEKGEVINMHIAMQSLVDEDPWMHEPLTEEELKCLDQLDGDDFEAW